MSFKTLLEPVNQKRRVAQKNQGMTTGQFFIPASSFPVFIPLTIKDGFKAVIIAIYRALVKLFFLPVEQEPDNRSVLIIEILWG